MSPPLPSTARASQAFPPAASDPREDARPLSDLVSLTERITQGDAGFLVVRTESTQVADALRDYVVRQAEASGRLTIAPLPRAGAPLWHDVAMHLSSEPSQRQGAAQSPQSQAFARGAEEPSAIVDHLIASSRGRRIVIVAPLPAEAAWDKTVAVELAGRAHPFLVVFVTSASGPVAGRGFAADASLQAEHFELAAKLTPREREIWWSVLAESAGSELAHLDLAGLEAWWTAAHRAPSQAHARTTLPRALSEGEADLFVRLALAGRPWRTSEIALLGGHVTHALLADALVADGVLRDTLGWLTLEPRFEDEALVSDASPTLLREVAHALDTVAASPIDPWAYAHAAQLYLRAGDPQTADAAIERALAHVEDSVARNEMSTRWASAVGECPVAERLALQQRGAERALAVGEAEEAHRWARAAAALAPQDLDITLLLGRSLVALGDLVAAEVTLKRGAAVLSVLSGGSSKFTALAGAELAEIAYLKGDMTAAATEATAALALATVDGSLRDAAAKARNTLGKILLAEAKWDEADRHFAEDALASASTGDTTSELRARLNRGIAFLSKGALDEARSIFEEVRREGDQQGDFRAVAFALDNLAVVATLRHHYAEALQLSERTLKLRRRLGDRLTTARVVGNLAELRRKLGLLEHAEHAVAFGRRALGPGMPPERSAHFSFVAARIALDRGHTETAQREVGRAVRDGELAGHREILAEAHRVSARIALEDGNLVLARSAVLAAKELMASDEARAEVALIEALLARASGEDAELLGLSALGFARVSGEEEGLFDAHLLLCETYRGRGELDAARSHLMQATSLRDQVTGALPADVASAFLSRRNMGRMERLESQLAAAASIPPPGSSSELLTTRPVSSRTPSQPPLELVGADPVMRGLYATIKKVARSSSTILIRGESGTGKELVAAALHRASDRAAGPMVTVNCAALVETLLLSELFGHEKGAFTGATARRRGRFELAEGGTLFLDEIGDISAKTQVALLRVLQERTFERVGGMSPIHVDVHVICATHRDLRAMVERGEFREDLYYRLRGITLDVPALRARLGDLPALVDHLLGRIAAERGEAKKTLTRPALDLLALHPWPGNVRELENALRAASLFADGTSIGMADLTDNVDDLRKAAERVEQSQRKSRSDDLDANGNGPLSVAQIPQAAPTQVDVTDDAEGDDDGESPLPVDEANATSVAYAQVRQGALSLSDMKRQIERDCISRALVETKGNITRAAALLGMKRPRLSQLVKHYGLATVTSEAS